MVQSGELGTADTMHRLHEPRTGSGLRSHRFSRTGIPNSGLHGRGGRLYGWYGIGQSLLMLPADLIGTWIAHRHIFSDYEDDPAIRSIVVSYSTNILVNVLTALIVFRFLRQLSFTQREAVYGVLALLFCTTHLHYTQNMMENNYILLLTLTGFSYQYEWLRTGSKRALQIGSAALGLNLLTRLTTGLDLLAVGVFMLTVLLFERVRAGELWRRLLDYCKVAAPIYLVFLLDRSPLPVLPLPDRLPIRISPCSQKEQRLIDPTLPPNFPLDDSVSRGHTSGPLFAPEKSIFLFDPLLALAIILLIVFMEAFGAGHPEPMPSRPFRSSPSTSVFTPRYLSWAGDFCLGRSGMSQPPWN